MQPLLFLLDLIGDHMSPLKPFCSIGLLIGVALFVGCGSDEDHQDVHKVSGVITMNGAPVANAIVTYSPKEKQPVAMGRTDSKGQYALTTYDANDGAVAGAYVILVSKSGGGPDTKSESAMHDALSSGKGVGNMHAAAKSGGASDSLLPQKYGVPNKSDLTATVKTNEDNKFDFDLKP